ncbi:MAG: hypothetical protein HY075_04095 [Deltaproteobacteria bacterium]|nr:hypothetical protein [Deltaproteobacteria bacterium]
MGSFIWFAIAAWLAGPSVFATDDVKPWLARITADYAASVTVLDAGDRYLLSDDDSSWEAMRSKTAGMAARLRETIAAVPAPLTDELDVPLYRIRRQAEQLEVVATRIERAHAARAELDAASERPVEPAAAQATEACAGFYLKTLSAALGAPCPSCLKSDGGKLARAVSPAEALDLFGYVSREGAIPFHAIDGGCFARAHAMSYLLEKKGVYSRKIFVHGNLDVKSKWAASGEAKWWFHVATLVRVDFPGKGPVDMVFDPSLSSCPLTVQQWTSTLTPQKCSMVAARRVPEDDAGDACQTFTTERFHYNISMPLGETSWRQLYLGAMGDELASFRELERKLVLGHKGGAH